MSRPLQYKPFEGELGGIMPDGDYFACHALEAEETSNESCWSVWDVINREAQILSTMPAAQQPSITQDLIAQILNGINRSFAAMHSRVGTRANAIFTSTFGGPARYRYEDYPIRWCAENREALTAVLAFNSSLFQIPQVPSNRLDQHIMDNHAGIIARPLFALKARIMREWFQIETKGHISPDELDAIFRDSNLLPPLRTSYDDVHDSAADQAAEDSAALGNESSHMPTAETVVQAKNGIEVWSWVPSQGSWLTFAEIVRRYEATGPGQVPGEPFPFAGDGVISGAAGGRRAGVGPANLQPQT